MFQRIIVPLDGSSRAERAIPVAAHLARVAQGSIVFLRVVVPEHEVGFYGAEPTIGVMPGLLERALAEADQYLSSLVTTFSNDLDGIKVEAEVETGGPAAMIASAARWEHADLVVMCSHGDTGFKRWVFNSIALQTARKSPVPVLILNERDETHPLEQVTHPLRVLVPLDGSSLAESALIPIVQLVKALAPEGAGTLDLLSVVAIPALSGGMAGQASVDPSAFDRARTEVQRYLDGMVKRLREEVEGTTSLAFTTKIIVSPDVPGTIIQQAEVEGCDLIAMGTHGRGALTRVLLGSVTERVVGYTTLPLLVVRPPKAAIEHKEATDPISEEKQYSSWVGLL